MKIKNWKAYRNVQKLSIYGFFTVFFGCLIALELDNLALGTKLLGVSFLFLSVFGISVILTYGSREETGV